MLSRLKHLKVFFKDKDKKNVLKILCELIHFTYIKKSLPTDYFRKFLYRKDIKDYTSYLSIKEFYSIIESPKLVFPEISKILSNKLSFKLITEKQNLPSPKLISYNLKSRYIFETKSHLIEVQKDLYCYFENLFLRSNTDKIFLKPIYGIGGYGCFFLSKESLEEQLSMHANNLLSNSYIHEAYIEQHELINAIYPHAINTLRMVHYIDKDETVHIISTFMRFGTGNSITDNTSSGGFAIAVNAKTGALQGVGRQEISRGAAVFKEHPDSLHKLEGFKVPYFKEACSLVKTFAEYFPSRIVGWDIAITPNGPVMIEGNHNPGLHVSDITYGGYLKNEHIIEILKEIKS